MSALVSVVVPVFNTRPEYIYECLDSIKSQTHKEMEVIIVDDGSNSETAQLLDMYCNELNNWKVVHQENSGLNMARKAGYEASTGEYITFVDSDDIVSPIFVETLYEACINNDTDYAVAEMVEFSDSGNIHTWGNPYENRRLVERDTYELIKDQIIKDGSRFSPHRTYEGLVWGKVYARSLISKIDWKFSNYKITEDEFFSIQIHIFTTGVSYVYEQLYFYRVIQADSLGKKVKPNGFNGQAMPYIQIAREVYENFKILFSKNNIKYEEDDLLLFYAKILIDRTRKLVESGEIDELNKKEYVKQALTMTAKIDSSKTISDEWKVISKLIYIDPVLAMQTEDVLLNNKVETEKLSEYLSSPQEPIEKPQYGVKGSVRQLGAALVRKVKNR